MLSISQSLANFELIDWSINFLKVIRVTFNTFNLLRLDKQWTDSLIS